MFTDTHLYMFYILLAYAPLFLCVPLRSNMHGWISIQWDICMYLFRYMQTNTTGHLLEYLTCIFLCNFDIHITLLHALVSFQDFWQRFFIIPLHLKDKDNGSLYLDVCVPGDHQELQIHPFLWPSQGADSTSLDNSLTDKWCDITSWSGWSSCGGRDITSRLFVWPDDWHDWLALPQWTNNSWH